MGQIGAGLLSVMTIPYSYAYYWADSHLETRYFCNQQTGGHSLMIWVCFSSRGQSGLVFVSNKMDSKQYVSCLRKGLIPFGDLTMKNSFIFQ